MRKGSVLTISGIDGSGKTTKALQLAGYFMARREDVLLTREPWKALDRSIDPAPLLDLMPLKKRVMIRGMDQIHLSQMDEYHRYYFDRLDHIHRVIQPALELGALVICDRYHWDQMAYQQSEKYCLDQILLDHALCPYPDLSILMSMPTSLAIKRIQERGLGEGWDEETLEKAGKNFKHIFSIMDHRGRLFEDDPLSHQMASIQAALEHHHQDAIIIHGGKS